jgi:hypothetical protein
MSKLMMIVYAKYDKITGHADPRNGASLRVLEKAGFTKGEYKKAIGERSAYPGVKTDLQAYYFNRPTS